jgi:hypothetical protein
MKKKNSEMSVLEEYKQHGLQQKIKERVFVIFGENYRIRRINDYQKQLVIVDTISLMSSIIGTIIAIVSAELNLTFEGDGVDIPDLTVLKINSTMSTEVFYCRLVVSILTGILVLCTFIHYKILLKLGKAKMNLRPEESLISTGYYKYMIFEILLSAVHTPPGVNGSVSIAQRDTTKPLTEVNIDYFLTILLLFFRSYHPIKYIAYNSRINNYDCEKLCLESRIPMDFLFCIKATFKESPFLLSGLILLLSIIIFGYSLRSVEMFFMFQGDANKVQDWRYFWNGMWCIIVTMSTVGFGEFYPISLLGRAIVVISSIWGNFLISLMVAALTVTVEFSPQEAASFDTIKIAQDEIVLGEIGVICLQNIYRYNKFIKNAKDDLLLSENSDFRREKSWLFAKLKNSIEKFREMRKVKNKKIESAIIEMAISQIDQDINLEMEKIKYNCNLLCELKYLLEEYNKNQEYIKNLSVELYAELDEISIFKDKHLKQL